MKGMLIPFTVILIITTTSYSGAEKIVKGCRKANCPFYPEPPANVTFFPHDTQCSRYCMCDWYSSVHDMPCPDGLHWNAKIDTCDWPRNAGCDDSRNRTTSTPATPITSTPVEGCLNADCPRDTSPPANVTFFPHDTDCTRYCMCDWYGFVHNMRCPHRLHWNTNLDTCDWSWDAGCDNSATTVTSTITTITTPIPSPVPVEGCLNADCPWDISPPENVTFFPHDTDCGRYCMCDWYSTVHDMACPDGLHWNTNLNTCDWPWNAGCDDSLSTTSTESEPIITEPPKQAEGCRNANCPFYPKPPANVTFFPHDTDCGRYCMCDWFGASHNMPCGDGLHWNSRLDTCDWPRNAGCAQT